MKRLRRILTGFWLAVLVASLVIASLFLGGYVAISAYKAEIRGEPIVGENALHQLADQGEFFGGHFATIISALTLALVVFATYSQARDSREATLRATFASGIDSIARYDIAAAGCPQALRLLNYYSGLALEHHRRDYYLFLNTVITASLRDELRKVNCPYPLAKAVRLKIANIRLRDGLRARYGFPKGTLKYFWKKRRR